ncbi:hypothetical protein AB0H69_35550 [Streptomyces phaeochromogenes]|uniref:hypothetical protein n=1 Tax=Streptomyces phaeochromogenes TaxID=1923 RepID=UPI0033FFFE7C
MSSESAQPAGITAALAAAPSAPSGLTRKTMWAILGVALAATAGCAGPVWLLPKAAQAEERQ